MTWDSWTSSPVLSDLSVSDLLLGKDQVWLQAAFDFIASSFSPLFPSKKIFSALPLVTPGANIGGFPSSCRSSCFGWKAELPGCESLAYINLLYTVYIWRPFGCPDHWPYLSESIPWPGFMVTVQSCAKRWCRQVDLLSSIKWARHTFEPFFRNNTGSRGFD